MSDVAMPSVAPVIDLYGEHLDPLTDPAEEAEAQKLFESMKQHASDYLIDITDQARPHQVHQYTVELVRGAVNNYLKNAGSLPGGIEEIVRAFVAPPIVSWQDLLKAWVRTRLVGKPARGMEMPSKTLAAISRHLKKRGPFFAQIAKRLPLFPGSFQDVKFRIAFVIDTSGSMGRHELELACTNLQHIRDSGVDIEILVLYIDTQVAKSYILGPGDALDFSMCGRGGTYFETAFAHVTELMAQGQHFDMMIYATDGYADKPKTRVPFPCLWLLTPTGQDIMAGAPGHATLRMQDYPAGAQI